MTTEILILLFVFQIKHLIADYYLQFPYMYENKGKKYGWFRPLLDHTGIHFAGTMFILVIYSTITGKYAEQSLLILFLGIFDAYSHFMIDRWKATQKTNPSESWFWKSLGIDQMIHHIVGILIIWCITQGV